MEANQEHGIRLLLVDDEVEFLEAIAPPLARRGFLLTLAEHGAAALRLLGQCTFDVVVLDVRMPGISGVDLFYKIKRVMPDLPIIMLTGHATVNDAFRTSRDGAFEYLTKPCDVNRLAEVARAAARQTAHSRAGSDTRSTATVAGARVLLADDDEDYVQALSPALERRRLDVTTAGTAVEALRQAETQVFDVAVVDASIRGARDVTLVRALKRTRPELEVLVLTARPTPENAVESLRAGAFAFLSKPLPIDTLLDWISDAVASARSRGATEREKVVKRILDEQPD